MFNANFTNFLRTSFLWRSSGRLLLNIDFLNNLSVWSTKHCNCLGQSLMLGYVNIENKIVWTFHSYVKSRRDVLKTLVYQKLAPKIDIQSCNICFISCYTYTYTKKKPTYKQYLNVFKR